MRFVDIAYYYNPSNQPETLLESHRANLGYFDFLPAHWQNYLIKFADGEGHVTKDRFDYYYFQGKKGRLWMPLRTNRFVKQIRPDAVLVHGLIFPHQVLLLRQQL